MSANQQWIGRSGRIGVSVAALMLAGCAAMHMGGVRLNLSGSQEVPPVSTSASGSGSIHVHSDKSVSGSVTTTGVAGTMAHIHQGASGTNGPVIVTLSKSGDTWSVPANSRFTDAQYDAYKAGNLYVNVHSAAHKGGEIRAQIRP